MKKHDEYGMNMVLTCVNNPQSYECSAYGMLIILANKHSSMLSEQRVCQAAGIMALCGAMNLGCRVIPLVVVSSPENSEIF